MIKDGIHKFVGDQLSLWPLACQNFRALKQVKMRELEVGGLKVMLQFNPARIISSAAKLNKEDISARKCFLCRENRPSEQIRLDFEGRQGRQYDILVNPYPIFPDHLVIAMSEHTDQSIWRRYVDMLDLSHKYRSSLFFYNGPRSGASAPDHHHFQAAPKESMPLVNDILSSFASSDGVLEPVATNMDAQLFHYKKFTTGVFAIRSSTVKSSAKLFYRLLDCADILSGDTEPRINLFASYDGEEYLTVVVFRKSHRSHHYFSEGEDHLTMSPGCADMGGVFIVPVEKEYEALTSEWLSDMVREVSVSEQEQENIIWRMTRSQPVVNVGILRGKRISFEIISDGAGLRTASFKEGKIEYDGALYDELFFEAPNPSTMFAGPSFILHDVTIGIGFHWERKQTQTFAGGLKIVVDKGMLTAINVIGVEDYLVSVISSEMSAAASGEFLKAHSVISRSWLMRQIRSVRDYSGAVVPEGVVNLPSLVSELDTRLGENEKKETDSVFEYVKWYDKDDHTIFDVCADDHCQRYQGLTDDIGEKARKAVDATWGQVLISEGTICDARFSKCCGGVMERFSTCWDDKDYAYLQPLADTPDNVSGARVFCDTSDALILDQVLKDYDRETVDFYRWEVEYDRDSLSTLIKEKGGFDIGRLQALEPLEKGESGRIHKLKIVGSEKTLVVGKELEIRKVLSESHLKSSAFEVLYMDQEGSFTESSSDWKKLVLKGKGWGHGVGLCQIGAAVMASEGYSYEEILQHYYPSSRLS